MANLINDLKIIIPPYDTSESTAEDDTGNRYLFLCNFNQKNRARIEQAIASFPKQASFSITTEVYSFRATDGATTDNPVKIQGHIALYIKESEKKLVKSFFRHLDKIRRSK